ncbi:MAG: sugar phosphate isomerase/epimerase [Desulfobulbaceae bacterium]|nr:MAG: sugar phosphate isomerase/epimerase [Desulfobulbaceae bacterium]
MLASLTLEYTINGSLLDRLASMRAAGFHAINLGTPHTRHLLSTSLSETKQMKTQIRHHELVVDWVHAPYRSPILYDRDHKLYHLSVAALKSAVLICSELEARSLIVHPFGLEFPPDIDQLPSIEQLAEALSVLVDYGKVLGVEIGIENINEPYSSAILPELLTRVEGLKFCLDTGHAHHYNVWDHYIVPFIDKICALHIHDNHGDKDEHLIPGDGTIDYLPLLKALRANGYNGYLGIECLQKTSNYPGDHPELAVLIKKRMDSLLSQIQ